MIERLVATLSERYRLEPAARSRGSADVAKATFDLRECRISNGIPAAARSGRHFSDISRAAAFATSMALFTIILMIAACSDAAPDHGADSAAVAAANADSIARSAATNAATLRDSAQATLATLLDDPASAVFDSVVVIQPPPVDGRSPAPAVCGRIGGKPGIGGRSTPTRFVYQGRWTVFVEEAGNQAEFAAVWAKMCDGAGGTVLLGG